MICPPKFRPSLPAPATVRALLWVAAGLGVGPLGLGCHTGATPSATTGAEQAVPKRRVVQVTAEGRQVPQLVPVLGSLVAERRTQLAANAAGRVVAVQCERGQMVEQNQILLTLDVRSATNAAKEARANLENLRVQRQNAKADCDRFEALHKKQAITQQEYERTMAGCHEADAQLQAAEARVEEALRTLKDGEVRAPFAGLISERAVNVGDYVRQDSPVATLLVPDPLRLQVGIPEAYAAAAKPERRIVFTVAAYPGREFEGTVRYVSGEVRTQTRDILVEASVPNPNHELLAGMFATAFLVAGERELPVVPKTALRPLGDGFVVFVVREGIVEQHAVRTGRQLGDVVAIESGLAVGDRVVDRPESDLIDGQSVE